MASLKAIVAASPEPVIKPSKNGPTAAATFITAGLSIIATVNASTSPMEVIPATNTPAAMMMDMIFAYPSPIPSKKEFAIALGLVRVTRIARIAPITIAAGTLILNAGMIAVAPSRSITIGMIGMIA